MITKNNYLSKPFLLISLHVMSYDVINCICYCSLFTYKYLFFYLSLVGLFFNLISF